MALRQHPIQTLVDDCAPLAFAPLPDIRVADASGSQEDPPDVCWHRADLVVERGELGPIFDRYASLHGPGHRLADTTHFLRALLREPVFMVSSSIYLTGRAPLLDPEHLWFPVHADGTIGVPTITAAKTAVLPDDPASDHPDCVVVPDTEALDQIAAEHMVRTFAPLLQAVSQHTRAGLRTLWGWVLDITHFYMLNPARFLGRDANAAWERAHSLGDALVTAGALVRARPRLFPFSPEHPRGTWAVRGTCCFDYKADAEHGYCVTCPLRSDADRMPEFHSWLRDPALAP
ncbi:(2Fe-2S)-binding protein [Spiractinospora alimapuensis]|uniref:(2Fe-2S)-binding protein n=1 Tax=Spiractinospora alimapuensis TaxID=2820884 RepID=UPI001F22060B|nr:(2Fe-2S)-binding protein [Spiractinospora alimapuensis]QVQ51537.1 (2Fe-2S)-binding protein [Spiractinospora alimapuensis]